MRIGHSTWWKYFGWPTTEPPLEIGLTMGGLSDRRTGAGPHQLLIAVKIRPQHVLRNSKPFQDHAIEMTQELKRYFAVC
jgi:tRNA G46 methylase TrmB